MLKEENAQLRAQMQLVQEKVAHISATLDRVERFDAKLRTAVTQLQDPERNLAIGPVGNPIRRLVRPGACARGPGSLTRCRASSGPSRVTPPGRSGACATSRSTSTIS